MIGSATIPITYQEFQKLFDQPHPVLYYSGLTMDWFITTLNRNPAVTEQAFETMQVRILNQDYRHYFGEVVDLAKYTQDTAIDGIVLDYLGKTFFLNKKSKIDIVKYYTDLVNSDLPNINIKFIFS
jgi:hypothetical protein